MKIDKEHLQKLAHLARIKVNPEMEDDLINDMEQIISWVDKLDELDTKGVAPLMHMTVEKNAFRADVAQEDISKEQALKNAPSRQNDFFSVPKVLDKKNG
jgi:aspartyl-tRNA(Asn)/glutamyl-tRNA(Gln) amidotransferase subunit C